MKRILFVLFSFVFVSTAHAETSSMSRLMAAGQSVQCTFAKPDGSESGTIYVAGDKFRGDFITAQDGPDNPTHMIRNAQKMYTWGGEMGQQGIIIPLSMGAAGPNPMGNQQQANMDEEMDFTCSPWSGDASQFEPPSDVAFQDMSQLMAGMGFPTS